jgi:AraC-like DNA-binding protein
MQCLTQGRMSLAATHLSRSSAPLARIAEVAGYQTDAAYGRPPAAGTDRPAVELHSSDVAASHW